MSEETLRAFSFEAKVRADRKMNDYVYAFDLHGETTLYASDLAKVIADRDDLLEALELAWDYMSFHDGEYDCQDQLKKMQSAIAKAKEKI